jgi:hypothetical protein
MTRAPHPAPTSVGDRGHVEDDDRGEVGDGGEAGSLQGCRRDDAGIG